MVVERFELQFYRTLQGPNTLSEPAKHHQLYNFSSTQRGNGLHIPPQLGKDRLGICPQQRRRTVHAARIIGELDRKAEHVHAPEQWVLDADPHLLVLRLRIGFCAFIMRI